MLALISLHRFSRFCIAAGAPGCENGVILYHENLEPGLNGFWVEVKDLREGDVFIGANGELLTLAAMERVEFEENIKVYNFTVDGNHNYFVIAETDEYGQTCVLVHNAEYESTPKKFKIPTLDEMLADEYNRRVQRYSSHYNNLIYDLLKASGVRPTPTQPIYPGQPGYNPPQGVDNPPGWKVYEKDFGRWGIGVFGDI